MNFTDARKAGCTFPSPHAAKPHRQRRLLCNEDGFRLCSPKKKKKEKHSRKWTFNRNRDCIALFFPHEDINAGKKNHIKAVK